MIDGFKCSCVGLSADLWQNNNLLDFGIFVSESTGEIYNQRRKAEFKGIHFVLSPRLDKTLSCSMSGSLHKHANANQSNCNDFTFKALQQSLNSLTDNFSVDLKKTPIHSLEVGLNIKLEMPAKSFLKSVICHKGKPFEQIDHKAKYLGLRCDYEDYTIKLYDKSRQAKEQTADNNILRYEVKLNRQRGLEPYGIRTLEDLQNVEKVAMLIALLLEKLSEIIFFDFAHQPDELTENQRLNWGKYSSPKYWENLNKSQHYKARHQYSELQKRDGAIDIKNLLLEKLVLKWFSLLGKQADLGRLFPQLLERLASMFRATFSNLEYVLEKVSLEGLKSSNKNLPILSKNLPKKESRFCVSCGRDISDQKTGSRFCSEKIYGKEAKRCRNKDSNNRLTKKRKIQRAMKTNLKIAVSYVDEAGRTFTDTLEVSEIYTSREWIDRITSIKFLPNSPKHPPKRLKGKKAQRKIKHINKSNHKTNKNLTK